jgi:hypothetical protein
MCLNKGKESRAIVLLTDGVDLDEHEPRDGLFGQQNPRGQPSTSLEPNSDRPTPRPARAVIVQLLNAANLIFIRALQ